MGKCIIISGHSEGLKKNNLSEKNKIKAGRNGYIYQVSYLLNQVN